jgi:glycosyltransferase involved in cell wall biosynthesis
MACGTPVVAFDRGSMRELIEEGTTGRLVSDVAGAVDAVSHIGTLDRLRIRSQAVTRFGHDRMVDAYVAVYRQVVAAGPGRSVG